MNFRDWKCSYFFWQFPGAWYFHISDFHLIFCRFFQRCVHGILRLQVYQLQWNRLCSSCPTTSRKGSKGINHRKATFGGRLKQGQKMIDCLYISFASPYLHLAKGIDISETRFWVWLSRVFVSRKTWTCPPWNQFWKNPEAKDAQHIFGPKNKNNTWICFIRWLHHGKLPLKPPFVRICLELFSKHRRVANPSSMSWFLLGPWNWSTKRWSFSFITGTGKKRCFFCLETISTIGCPWKLSTVTSQ